MKRDRIQHAATRVGPRACARPRPRARVHTRGGSSLVWLLVLVAALVVGAGLALPARTQQDDAAAARVTRARLLELEAAAREFFRDVGAPPSALADLETTNGSSAWSGPYVAIQGRHPQAGISRNRVDGWGRAFTLAFPSAVLLRITSAGQDGASGGADDLARQIDLAPICYERTLEQLDTLNRSINEYRQDYPAAVDALPANVSTALTRLVARGYLPSSSGYASDAWGDALQPVTGTAGELVAVASSHCAGHPLYF